MFFVNMAVLSLASLAARTYANSPHDVAVWVRDDMLRQEWEKQKQRAGDCPEDMAPSQAALDLLKEHEQFAGRNGDADNDEDGDDDDEQSGFRPGSAGGGKSGIQRGGPRR